MRHRSPVQRRKESERPKAFALLFCRDTASHIGPVPTHGTPSFQAVHGLHQRRREKGSWQLRASSLPGRRDGLSLRQVRPRPRFRAVPSLRKHRSTHWADADSRGPLFSGGTEPFPPSQKGVGWQPQTIFSLPSRQEGLLLWQARPRPVFFADRSLRRNSPPYWGNAVPRGPLFSTDTGSLSPPQRRAADSPKWGSLPGRRDDLPLRQVRPRPCSRTDRSRAGCPSSLQWALPPLTRSRDRLSHRSRRRETGS